MGRKFPETSGVSAPHRQDSFWPAWTRHIITLDGSQVTALTNSHQDSLYHCSAVIQLCHCDNKRMGLSQSLTHNRSQNRRTRTCGPVQRALQFNTELSRNWRGKAAEAAQRLACRHQWWSNLPFAVCNTHSGLKMVRWLITSALPCYIINAYQNKTETKVSVGCQLLWKSLVVTLLWFIPHNGHVLRGKRWMFLKPKSDRYETAAMLTTTAFLQSVPSYISKPQPSSMGN
jgi:hypothetical protein